MFQFDLTLLPSNSVGGDILKIAKIPNPMALTLLVDLTLQRSNSFARRQKFLAESHTVSWRIRIFNCIEEVPRFFFAIELNSTFQISNYLQFNCTPDTI